LAGQIKITMSKSTNSDFGYSEGTDAHKLAVVHAKLHRARLLSAPTLNQRMPLTRHSPPIDHHSPSTHTSENTYENKFFLIVLFVTFRPSTVRFRLPLTPPQGLEMPPKPAQYREVGTMEAAGNVPKLNQSASRWRKADLDLLGVDYDYESCDDIHIPDAGMPTELVESNPFV
jgi:hypothetical protein